MEKLHLTSRHYGVRGKRDFCCMISCVLSGAWGFTKKLCSADLVEMGSAAENCAVWNSRGGQTVAGALRTVGEVQGVVLALLSLLDSAAPPAAAAAGDTAGPAAAAVLAVVALWRLMCLLRWSLRMKRRSQTGQPNFFSPVCVLLCRDSSSERANRFWQCSKQHTKGFSPATQKQHSFEQIQNKTCRWQSETWLFYWKLETLVHDSVTFLPTCVRSDVRFQVGTLEIGFVAVVVRTNMRPSSRHLDTSFCHGQQFAGTGSEHQRRWRDRGQLSTVWNTAGRRLHALIDDNDLHYGRCRQGHEISLNVCVHHGHGNWSDLCGWSARYCTRSCHHSSAGRNVSGNCSCCSLRACWCDGQWASTVGFCIVRRVGGVHCFNLRVRLHNKCRHLRRGIFLWHSEGGGSDGLRENGGCLKRRAGNHWRQCCHSGGGVRHLERWHLHLLHFFFLFHHLLCIRCHDPFCRLLENGVLVAWAACHCQFCSASVVWVPRSDSFHENFFRITDVFTA